MCGDGPIQEHPRGSLCQIAPVHDPEKDHYKYHPAIEIDLEELIEQLGPPPLDVNTLDDLAIESAQESLLLEPPGLGRKKGDVPGLRTPRGAPVAGIPVNSSIGGRA